MGSIAHAQWFGWTESNLTYTSGFTSLKYGQSFEGGLSYFNVDSGLKGLKVSLYVLYVPMRKKLSALGNKNPCADQCDPLTRVDYDNKVIPIPT